MDGAAPEKLNLTPIHAGELPIIQKFLEVISDLQNEDKWQALVMQFGKYRTLNRKTA